MLAHPVHAQVSQAIQLTHAEQWVSPSGAWEPPVTLAESDDAVLAPTTTWEPVMLPHTRPRELAGAAAQASATPQVQWYRVYMPTSALAPTPQGPRLYIPRWQTIGTVAVYVKGHLLWQSRGSRVWNSFNQPVWIDLGGSVQPGQPLVVHVRMASQPGIGGALSTLWAGPAEDLRTSWRMRSMLQSDLVALSRGSYLVLGLFALALWTLRRQHSERVFLLFFFMSVFHLLSSLQYLVDSEGFSLRDDWFSWLTLVATLGSSVCSFYFLCLVQRQRLPRLGRAMVFYTTTVGLLALPWWGWPHETILPALRLSMLPPALVVLTVAIFGAWRQRSGGSVVLAVWIALSVPIGLHDLALQNYRLNIEGIYLTPYVYVGLFTLFLLIAFTRYNLALQQVERANATLAERLAAQERALEQTHQRLLMAEREQTLMAERQRLMREMHDGVGSSLMTALRLVEHGDAARVNVPQVLKECIDDLKISIDSLEPVDADLLALLASLRFRLAPRLEGAGLTLHWQVADLPPLPWLDAQSALHVLRILQEVLTNIIKHSGARDITVSTAHVANPQGVQVHVSDDGTGFSPAAPDTLPTSRKGLTNIHSRAAALGGWCQWAPGNASTGGGTVFTLWLPLKRTVASRP